jgi:hypothetical protein
MSIFANKKETPIPYVPWEIRRVERVMRDNYFEVKRIKEKRGWCETNLGKIDRWFRKRTPNAELCLLLLIRIGKREGSTDLHKG